MCSFFFYDLETSGFNPRYDRIMQFAGQRTTMDLQPTGEPVNLLIKLSDDILPSPGAILTTHITPQMTLADGISETEFCEYFLENIATPDTIMVGYNNVRFDDEFMRHTLWRNFRDPYEWSWSEGRSRWDLLDVTRFVRALRPDGVTWPTKRSQDKVTGQWVDVPTVNLVDMAKSNGFENTNAHDALADVNALINLAKLLREHQPKMWQYMLDHRDKRSVASVIQPNSPAPFVYTSGRYASANEKTTVAIVIADGRTPSSVLVWDLRHSVAEYSQWSDQQITACLTASWEERRRDDYVPLPIKELGLNKCPAVAPLGTLDNSSQSRIHLTVQQVRDNLAELHNQGEFIDRLVRCWRAKPIPKGASDVESQLYDSFAPESDRTLMRLVAAADDKQLADLHPQFADGRLTKLLLRYKARQFPRSLTESEQSQWEKYRTAKLTRELPGYMQELAKLASKGVDDFILQELQLWAESITPIDY